MIESMQYNAVTTITGAIRGTSCKKFYQELGLESLRSRTWPKKLYLFYKIYENKSPSYLFNLTPDRVKFYSTLSTLLSVTHDITTSANEINNDLKKISDWAFQRKMRFNPDPSNQAQEVIFSRKLKNVSHPSLLSNNANVSSCKSQKHLGILLDAKLTFEEHYTKRTIGLLRKLINNYL